MSLANRFKRPEYTGENRCLPCTVVNVGIAGTLSIAVAPFTITGAVFVFLASVTTVYYRGYLVPGTPTLTKRYFPEWMLALFGKRSPPTGSGTMARLVRRLKGYQTLTERLEDAGIVVTRGGDVDLESNVEQAIYERVERLDPNDVTKQELQAVSGLDADFDLSGGNVTAEVDFHDDETPSRDVVFWESLTAAMTDVAAYRAIQTRSGLEIPDSTDEMDAFEAIRALLEECPSCGGEIESTRYTVETCCDVSEVRQRSCRSCEEAIVEIHGF